MIVWCGEKTHLVHYPLRRGELFNLVVVFHSDRYEEGWDTYGDPAELHARFVEKCEPVRTLLQKVNAWKMWVLCDRPPIKNWSKGRITLLGDAAHPMLQYLAQGGNMAMEDAVCLANQVEAAAGDYDAAFQKYQELRYLRTARVQLMARVFGEIYHASGVNRELRNKVLREWSDAGRRRHVVALRPAAGAAACRQRAAAAADAARRPDLNNRIHPGGEHAHGETRRPAGRPGDREPRAGEATASWIRSATSASAIPDKPDRFFLSCSRAPERVKRDDIMEFKLECEPIDAKGKHLYTERPIHGARLSGAARRDVGDPQPQPRRDPVSASPAARCGRSCTCAPPSATTCRSGTSTRNSATPTCWSAPWRQAAISPRSSARAAPR